MACVEIRKGYVPGVIGRVAQLHGTYYHEHWKFGLFFEAKVATELAEFLERYDDRRDGLWTVSARREIEGSIAVDGFHARNAGAHLRWFILSGALRGKGLGHQLMEAAVDFCRSCGYPRLFLWTFEGLNPARHLYEKFGFRLAEERQGARWGREVNEQRFELQLP